MKIEMSQDKTIEVLEKRLKEKDAELSELYAVLERLNSYVSRIIDDKEAGLRSVMSLHRKFTTKKIPKINELTFASRYIISTSELNSYFDFFALPDEAGAGLVMTDANGYGLSAMVMSIIASLLETPCVKSPKTFVGTVYTDIKKYIEKDNGTTFNPKGKTASLIYMTLERKGLVLKYCSLGMPGIIIVRGKERKILENSEGSFKLHPGDKIIVSNNGLINATNATGSKFTLDGIQRGLVNAEHLPIPDIINNIGFELDSFIDSKRSNLPGDMSIVGVELERKMLYVV